MPALASGIRGDRLKLGDRTVIGLVLAGLAGALTIAFFIFFKPVEETVRSAPSLEARQNRFLAAERFLQRAGLDAETVGGLGLIREPPSTDHALLLDDRPGSLSTDRRRRLDAWMAEGGTLITVASHLWDADREASGDDLLDGYGVRQYSHGQRGARCSDTDRATAVLADVPRDIRADFRPQWYLTDASGRADGHVSGPCGRHLLTYPVGEGRLTVLTDSHLWHNHAIEEGDHAFLLGRVLALSDPAKVWILRRARMPGLTELVWEHGREALLALLALVGFALWAAYDRFGPPLPAGRAPRRSLSEHLDAMAGFQARQGRYQELIAPVREHLAARLEQRLPQWRHWDRERQTAWLAKRTGLPVRDLDPVLFEAPGSERELAERIQTLQELGRRL